MTRPKAAIKASDGEVSSKGGIARSRDQGGANDAMLPRSLIILFSYHHKNTEKIADVVAKVLNAPIRTPQQLRLEEMADYDLIGFASGIYSGRHHESLLNLADTMPRVTGKKAFIFSTYSGVPAFVPEGEGRTRFQKSMAKNHAALRGRLLSKGYLVVDEFSCAGHDTNSFLRLFGGISKGRPNSEDLKRTKMFALNLRYGMERQASRTSTLRKEFKATA